MKKGCSKNDLLTINGILGIHCQAPRIGLDPAQPEELPDLIAEGNAFLVTDTKKLVLTVNNVEAQTATGGNGTIYQTAPTYEGYTAEYPPTLEFTKKLKAIKDTCDRCYLVDIQEDKYVIYGLRREVAGNWLLDPFDFENVTTSLPNGRFSGGSVIPLNNISFILNEMDIITDRIGSIEYNSLAEFEIAFINLVGSTITFYDDSDTDILLSEKTVIPIPVTADVDIANFEYSAGYTPTAIAVTDGAIVLTPTPTAGTKITQIQPISGLMSLNTTQI